MHSTFRKRGVILAGLLALALAAALPSTATAKPEPGAKKSRGFRLFSSPLGAMTINRIYCGLTSDGQVCVDSTNSSTVGGGYWPKGTADQYIFNSGLQLAGIVGTDGGPWAGDTTGAFFFDPKGTTQHGTQVEPIYNTTNSADVSSIQAGNQDAAYVPFGDASADLFNPLLTGSASNRRVAASQGDVWFMSWDGDPSLNAGRKHPLGIVVETRGMGWNFPTGNEDIIYFIYTFYNVTTTNPADYVNIRPEMQAILLDKAAEFQSKNNATFNVTLPTGGYTIDNLFAAFATDMDVAQAGVNYSSVNLPFALGYTYVQNFAGEVSWSFDANLFSAPFFPGAGFAGIKYLKSPSGPGAIQLFSNTVNGSPFSGAFNDPQNTIQLWRYLSGNISVPAGDQPCNSGNPSQTRLCWINNTQAADMRFFQSSSGFSLPPGGQGSIVVAYIFAAPVATPGCPAPGATCGGGNLKPGNPALLGVPAAMAGGVNAVDSISGFLSATDLDGSGLYEQAGTAGPEWKVVPGSLLGKSYTAQAVFDAKFLLPFAPDPPKFFLIPSNNQVTVVWQATASEADGDPYYAIASDPASALYDPNYREFDVEGYRIYRGRTDSPDDLALIAQFDFAGTIFNDYDGVINYVDTCAPELNIYIDCPVPYSPVVPGQPRTVANPNNIISPFVTTRFGGRLELASGLAITTASQEVLTEQGYPPLRDTGVPYIYVDNGVRNNFRYFYVVTAFDVNSWSSGPTTLESPRAGTQAVIPQALASNLVQTGTLTPGMFGRPSATEPNGTNQSLVYPKTPGMNTNGTFTGPFPPATVKLGFVGFASQVVGASGALAVTLDSLSMGNVDLSGCCGGGAPAIPGVYYFTLSNGIPSADFQLAVPLAQDLGGNVSTDVYYAGPAIDASLASMYGGDNTYGTLTALFQPTLASGPQSGDWGLGGPLNEPGFTSADFPSGVTGTNYNGIRWFDGPSPQNNEVRADPTSGSCGVGNSACAANGTTGGFNNAGQLAGVTTVYQPLSYNMFNREWRNMGEATSTVRRAADYNVYWGTGGLVDSVIDVTHNVVVPFQSTNVNGGWGILNTANQGAGGFDNRPTVATPTDFTCVRPFYQVLVLPQNFFPCTAATPFTLSNTAALGTVAFGSGDNQSAAATRSVRNPANVQAQGGFFMYLAGTITGFEMAALPTAGTVWSLRDYTGIIYGGNGTGQAGNRGPYSFVAATRPFTAIGATMGVQYDVVNNFTASASNLDLSKIHTVPDPYYVTSPYEVDYTSKIIKFVNLPLQATIRIYSSSGVLVRVLSYSASENGGMLDWNVRNRNNQVVASGVYFYHVESGDARFIGRMTIVNFAK